jgi:hypothetical protein
VTIQRGYLDDAIFHIMIIQEECDDKIQKGYLDDAIFHIMI